MSMVRGSLNRNKRRTPVPVDLQRWTLGYDAISVYGQLTNQWQPTGSDWEVIVTEYYAGDTSVTAVLLSSLSADNSYIIHRDSRIGYSLGSVGGGSFNSEPGLIANNTLHTISLSPSIDEFSLDGVVLQTPVDAPAIAIQRMGVYSGVGSSFFEGQIHTIQLIDNDTPSNSITINNVIASATQPTDFNIYNELNGLVIGEYFNGAYELVEGV